MVPGAGSIELTRRCNLNCPRCTLVHPLAFGASAVGELSRRQIMHIVDGLADVHLSPVRLYGGEVYLRKDLEDILRHTSNRHIGVVLDTNGTLLTSRRADFLADIAPRCVEMPLFGATEAAYELATGVRGSYALFRRGVELLLRRQVTVRLRGVPLTGQGGEREGMAALAARMGVPLDWEQLLQQDGQPAGGVETPGLVRLRPTHRVRVGAG